MNMNTPVCNFAAEYAAQNLLRAHMPGHKGVALLGPEALDITEITGADSLYEAEGIIRQSEQNAGMLFGANTFYSTEGSSQCIRAMLYLLLLHAKARGQQPVIAAGRNAHKAFLSALALLDIDVVWLHSSQKTRTYLSCPLTAADVEAALQNQARRPTAIYITSPDYLGNTVDIQAIAQVCRQYNVLLAVDNAHGAYLKFLPRSQHPIELGATICCDSAHKTLPGITGTAYLHISHNAPAMFAQQAKNALAMFGSTSPSYLALQSLDALNKYLSDGYAHQLACFVEEMSALKKHLIQHGYVLQGDEPMKLTLCAREYGYDGREMADILLQKGIVCEFFDPDFVVFMLTPQTGSQGLTRLETVLLSIERGKGVFGASPALHIPKCVMSVRAAAMSPSETLPAQQCLGRTLATVSVGCPPAVPIVVCGEQIDAAAIELFEYYGIQNCTVIA